MVGHSNFPLTNGIERVFIVWKVAILALVAGPAFAEGYSEHKGVTLFTKDVCGAAVAAIDADPEPGEISEADVALYGLVGSVEKSLEPLWPSLSKKGMAWGFLLGYDTAQGGLHTESQTTLERFRDACAANPNRTGLEILQSFKKDY